jgi:hypothetical protein
MASEHRHDRLNSNPLPPLGGCAAGAFSVKRCAKCRRPLVGRKQRKFCSNACAMRFLWMDRDYHAYMRGVLAAASKGRVPVHMSTIINCPHCGTSGNLPTLRRWHFNNCRQKDDPSFLPERRRRRPRVFRPKPKTVARSTLRPVGASPQGAGAL